MEYQINTNSLSDAWLETIKLIYNNGIKIRDEHEKLFEICGLLININVITEYKEKYVEIWESQSYSKQLNNIELFDYRQRLNNYNGFNQIKNIINKLMVKPESKSATAVTFFPNKDIEKVPCLISVDFKIRDNALTCYSFFRSQDAWKKQPYNFLLLRSLMNEIALSLDIPLYLLSLFISSAHIYSDDISEVEFFLENNYE